MFDFDLGDITADDDVDAYFGSSDKKILVLGNVNEVMANASINELRNRGFAVSTGAPYVNSVSQADEAIRIYFVIMERADLIKELLVYLKDIVTDKRKYVCIFGTKTEIPEIYKYIPPEDVAAVYERPIGVRELCDGLEDVYERSKTDDGKKSILLVDDDPAFLRRTQQILKNEYKVYVANSGVNAIMLLTKHKVDLVLLDYEMPVVNGPKVFEMIQYEPELQEIPVMFLTSKSDTTSVKNALKLEPKGYIIKTTPVEEFKAMIANYFLESRKMR